MDYNDQYVLSQVKKLQQTVSLLSSQLGNLIVNFNGLSQVYEVQSDPAVSGFLPDDTSKPAVAFIYDVDWNPSISRWWNVANQVWK